MSTSMTIEPPPAAEVRPLDRSRWLLALLAAVAVVLIAAGVILQIRAHSHRSSDDSNQALSDPTATARVVGQVNTALTKVLSYSYTNPAATKTAASSLLSGDAARQYATLFAALQKKAPGEKLTLRATIVSTGVTSLTSTTAQLLVFLDQSSTRASDQETSTAAAQIEVTAVKRGGIWRVTELHPL